MPKRMFSDQQECVIAAEYASGIAARRLADIYGATNVTIANVLKRRGMPIRNYREAGKIAYKPALKHIDSQLADMFVRDYISGKSITVIASTHGATPRQVHRCLTQQNVSMRPAKRHRVYKLDESVFDNAADSECAAYFIGLLMADGCITQTKHCHYITIGLTENDSSVLDTLREFLKTDMPIRLNKATTRVYNAKPARTLSICSNRIAESLAQYGVRPRKSMTAKVCGGLEFNRHFWRGAVDGDGFLFLTTTEYGITKPVIGFTGSLPMVKQCQEFMRSVSQYKAKAERNHSIWTARTKGAPAMDVIRALYADCHIAIPRKLSIAQQAMALSELAG